jgi:uncharacterized coiled-coil DUF342 family protein
MENSKFPAIKATLRVLQTERNTILEQSGPLREQRDRLLAKLQPELDKIKELEKQYRAIEGTKLADIDNQIGALQRILGAKTFSGGDQTDNSSTAMGM